MTTGALERTIRRSAGRRPAMVAEPCALCATTLAEEHPHMLDTAAGEPLCVCRACALLFDRPAASHGRYRRIPERRLAVEGIDPGRLGVPVGLAFFVVADDGSLRAHYPSPAGATRWDVDPEDWSSVAAECPALATLAPEVEALLVNTTQNRSEAWLVPVADCYRLVGLVRQHWHGMSGGSEVWPAVEEFFEQIRRSHGQDQGR